MKRFSQGVFNVATHQKLRPAKKMFSSRQLLTIVIIEILIFVRDDPKVLKTRMHSFSTCKE